ncbi:aldose 1-epimerase [Chitinophaga skermanii]|uniref:Aldose 1-epimerase n=1 Tax=Chitinophaga skermanii TaxID=331697 RepID=A0A327R2Y0_9BACT|nr:aldose epimerase family protein [Chitinophaga skermanii]RAJ10418.1 aldose 1-epimerase [Chitinophaga skermanii]
MLKSAAYCLVLMSVVFMSCETGKNKQTQADSARASDSAKLFLVERDFDTTIGTNKVSLFYLQNSHGTRMAVTNYGAKVVALSVPDRNGKFEDIVLGFSNIDKYFEPHEKYYGGVVGRYANRIGDSKFKINDTIFPLYANNGLNNLHGGKSGFNAVVWEVSQPDSQNLVFHYRSYDGEEGFPGNLDVNMVYTLTENNTFRIHYTATTDKATHVNLSHHSFFNLKGAGNGPITDHILMINANAYTPIKEDLIPTGEIAPVANTPLDFTTPRAIGEHLDTTNDQIRKGKGYDHNWVLNNNKGNLALAASILEPKSGRYMEVWTTEPGIQFYSGNFLGGADTGKFNKPYKFREAFCLETQHFPNSPNQPNFPSTLLLPGKTYSQSCEYRFSTK